MPDGAPATLAPVAPVSSQPARCDLCHAYWQPEAAADALTCRNTLTVCADADACIDRVTFVAELDRIIAESKRPKENP